MQRLEADDWHAEPLQLLVQPMAAIATERGDQGDAEYLRLRADARCLLRWRAGGEDSGLNRQR